jgi:hypothetical protein
MVQWGCCVNKKKAKRKKEYVNDYVINFMNTLTRMSKNVVYEMKFSLFCKGPINLNLFIDTLCRYPWQSASSGFDH